MAVVRNHGILLPVLFFSLCFCSMSKAEIAVQFNIDVVKDNRGISPFIYGSNTDQLGASEGVAFRRSGGNRLTGYNWENNASNAGNDWNMSSDDYMGGGNVPGKAMTDFHDHSLQIGAASLLTLPIAGYVAKDKKGSVSVAETAPSARWNKVVFAKGKPFSLTPDTTDGEVYSDEFVNLLVSKYGAAGSDKGVRFYDADNEPGIWPNTHPRIHPAKPTSQELVDRTAGVSAALKKVDPKAELFGGVFFGYSDYQNLAGAPDWNTLNAGKKYGWYIDYFLEGMKKKSDSAGLRLLDAVDIHWYSEAIGDHRINDTDAHTEKDRAVRVQAPRSLWDTTYAESSWVSKWMTPKQPVTDWNNPTLGPILLLPHIFASIQKYYPGTKLTITEYNYGESDQISGGLATADFLGIVGRAGVYAASYWPLKESPVFVIPAFRLFRNYDGNKSTFGSASAIATASDRENASVYASFNPAGNEIHVIVLNKNATETVRGNFNVTSPVSISDGRVFGFDKSGAAITEKPAIASVSANAFTYVLPPLSAYHLVLKTAGALPNAIRNPFEIVKDKATQTKSLYMANGRIFPAAPKDMAKTPALWLGSK